MSGMTIASCDSLHLVSFALLEGHVHLRKIGRLAAAMLAITAASAVSGAQRSGQNRDTSMLPKSSGLLTYGRDGQLRMASAARIPQEPGLIDKLGSFIFGLGYGAPAFNSAGLSLVRLTAGGVVDPGFGNKGAVVTPLLPRGNHDGATVTALLEDASGRAIVVGWRTTSTWLDAGLSAIVAARYSSSGALDASFGERGIVTTRIDEASVTQAFAATLDGDGRLLVAGYNGGVRKGNRWGSFNDWPVRLVLLRYTASGVLDPSFGSGGIASHVLVPSGPFGEAGREFLDSDHGHAKTTGLTLDREGRSVVAATSGEEGPVVLMRFTSGGVLDSSFGSSGIVQTPLGKDVGISSLLWDSEGRLLAAGSSKESAALLRYSADGALDTTFGDGGIRRTPIAEGVRVSAALQELDGHLLVVASGQNSVQLARYDRDGRPDQSVGANGVITTVVEQSVATSAGLAIDEKATPVVTVASANGIVLIRYNSGRPVDTSFLAVPNLHP
jgi:uncharacterized delta-60 repeat protein